MFSILASNLHECQHWSKEELRILIGQNLIDYKIEWNYHFTPKMLALYDFAAKPLFGKFKSLIIETERGMILTEKSSRQILDRFSRKVLMGNLELQREVSKDLGIQYYHMIGLGQSAYLSLKGHSHQNTDWVAAHNMADYYFENSQIVFKSVKIAGQMHQFAFPCIKNFRARIDESIKHNNYIYNLTYHYMTESIGWTIGDHNKESFLFKETDLTVPVKPSYRIQDLISRLIEGRSQKYGDNFADEYGIDTYDHKLIYRKSNRHLHHY